MGHMSNFVNIGKISKEVVDRLKLEKKCEGLNHIGVYWDSAEYTQAYCGVCERALTAQEQAIAPKTLVRLPQE